MQSSARALTAGVGGLILLAGCTEPVAPVEDGTSDTQAEPVPTVENEDDAQLREQIEVLRAAVTAAQEGLTEAQGADTLTGATGGARSALAALLSDGAGGTGGTDRPALLPAMTSQRGDAVVPDDVLTTTLTMAQDRGGALGTRTAEVLRDPIAGDLGAWQRDAGGMVDLARSAAAATTNVDALEQRILHLTGEATRALAWTFVAADASSTELARAAAERGNAHLAIIEAALDQLDPSSSAATTGSDR